VHGRLAPQQLSPRKIGHCRRHSYGDARLFCGARRTAPLPKAPADVAAWPARPSFASSGWVGQREIFGKANTLNAVTAKGRVHVTENEGNKGGKSAGLDSAYWSPAPDDLRLLSIWVRIRLKVMLSVIIAT